MAVGISLRAHLSTTGVEDELRRLIAHLADSANYIEEMIRQSNRSAASARNVYGEEQMALDVLADKLILNRLHNETSFGVNQFASEERNEVTMVHPGRGRYSVTVDPLDGSSLIDVNLAVGTILGIHDGDLLNGKRGRDGLVSAMYFLYGPVTSMVYTAGQGTHEFVMDSARNWVLNSGYIAMEEMGNIYGSGGLSKEWTDDHRAFVGALEDEGYKLRYSGAFVADVNSVLLKKGGLFSYPALKKSPKGKLRLLFEEQPMAFIVEQAGGRATTGLDDILNLVPDGLDERRPIYIGSNFETSLAEHYISQA